MTTSSDVFVSFGSLLKAFRKSRHLTQGQLATAVGVHRNAIGRWEQGDVLPATRGMVLELARHLKLDEQETRQLLEASLTALAPHWSVPFARNPYFTGREAILSALHTQLGADQAVALTQSLALHGLGGVGKTQIALEYAYRYALDYSAVFWIAAETEEQIIAGLLHIAETLQLPEREEKDQQRVVTAVQRWLSTHGQWLLVWDNVEDVTLLDRFLPTARSGAVLVTTRRQALGPLARGLDLSSMEPEEGMLLLLRRAKVLPAEATSEQLAQFAERMPAQYQAATDLVAELGGLPLALDQAGAYIEETGCGLLGYMRLYEHGHQQLLERRGEFSGHHPRSVASTLWLSCQRVAEQHPAALELLRLCACLSPDAIPEALFAAGAVHLGPVLGAVAADPAHLDQALAALRRFSLVQRSAEGQTVSLHRLVQVVLKDRMDATTTAVWIERALQALNATCPQPEDVATWLRCEQLVPHAQIGLQMLEQLEVPVLEAARFFQKIGAYLLRRGRYSEAEPFLLRALAISEQRDRPDPSQVATVLESLGEVYWRLDKIEQALSVAQRALTLCEQQLGPDHPLTADMCNNVGAMYWNQGKYEQARGLWERALAIHERCLGPDHPQIVMNLNNLAFADREQGEFGQAERLYQRALAIYERELGAGHPETALILMSLGRTYREQSNYEQAEPALQRGLKVLKTHDHPRTADGFEALGILYLEQGKDDQAESCLQRALALRTSLLGSTHSRTVSSLIHLGALYQRQGKDEQAEPLLQQALVLCASFQGAYRAWTADCLRVTGALYREQGKDEQAQSLLERAVTLSRESDGWNHYRTAQCLGDLALCYERQGGCEQAEQLYEQACTILEQRLGPEHPSVAHPLNGLANLARERGDSPKAERLYQRALSLREQKLGPDHPDTAQTLHDLALLRRKQGLLSEALSLVQRAHAIRSQSLRDAHPKTSATRALCAQLLQEQACAQGKAAPGGHPEEMADASGEERHEDRASSPFHKAVTAAPSEDDPLQGFLDACCELHPRAWCHSADLWQAYRCWTDEQQERYPLSRAAFIAQLKAHGCRADRTRTARIWRGIALVREARDGG